MKQNTDKSKRNLTGKNGVKQAETLGFYRTWSYDFAAAKSISTGYSKSSGTF